MTDGANATGLVVDGGARYASLSIPGAPGAGRQTFSLPAPPAGWAYAWSHNPGVSLATRNGPATVVRVALVRADGDAGGDGGSSSACTITYRLQAKSAAPAPTGSTAISSDGTA
jgi:hypothetical protein